jgi:HSP20 family protein
VLVNREVDRVLLTSIDPFLVDFDRLAQRVFAGADGVPSGRSVMPMDAVRGEGEIVLRFDLPGADQESIDVTVARGVLTVSARRGEEYGEDATLLTRERLAGTVTRRVSLRDRFDADKIEASYANGVLTVRLPFAEKALPRKVEIQAEAPKKITA